LLGTRVLLRTGVLLGTGVLPRRLLSGIGLVAGVGRTELGLPAGDSLLRAVGLAVSLRAVPLRRTEALGLPGSRTGPESLVLPGALRRTEGTPFPRPAGHEDAEAEQQPDERQRELQETEDEDRHAAPRDPGVLGQMEELEQGCHETDARRRDDHRTQVLAGEQRQRRAHTAEEQEGQRHDGEAEIE